MVVPIETDGTEGHIETLPYGVGLVGGHHVIVTFRLLQHKPHGFDIFLGVTPVALRVEIAEGQPFLEAQLDPGGRQRDFAGDEGFPAPRRLVVEENAVARVQLVGLPVIHHGPVGEHLGAGVGTAGPERRGLFLGHLLHQAKHLRGASLVKARLDAHVPDGLKQPDAARAGDVRSVFRRVKAHPDVALGGQIVNLVRLNLGHQPHQPATITQIPVVQVQPVQGQIRAPLHRIQPGPIGAALPANDAVNFVSFFEQQFGEIRTILTADAGDECLFGHMS